MYLIYRRMYTRSRREWWRGVVGSPSLVHSISAGGLIIHTTIVFNTDRFIGLEDGMAIVNNVVYGMR